MCTVVVALTLPAESILLKAVASDSQEAVQQWVAALSTDDLDAAANQVQNYPFAYRKQIMKALSPERRSEVWRNHIRAYVDHHPDLDSAALDALQAAIDVASPAAFASGSDTIRARVDAVGVQLVAAIGREEASSVMYRLGPRDGEFSSVEPLSLRLANFVRRTLVVFARAADCDCNAEWGCDGMYVHCADDTGCTVDDSWPACGWLWNDPCNGNCKMGAREGL